MTPSLYDDSKPSGLTTKDAWGAAAAQITQPSPEAVTDEETVIERKDDHLLIRRRNKDGSYSTVRRSIKDGLDPELDQHFLKGDFKKTIEAADARLAKNANDYSALWHKAESHAMLEQHDEAIAAYDRMLAINPDDAAAINNKAISVGAKGNHDEALRLYARAHQLDPKSAVIAGNLASAHFDRGDLEEALRYSKIALANGPTDEEHRKYLESIKGTVEAIKAAQTSTKPEEEAAALAL